MANTEDITVSGAQGVKLSASMPPPIFSFSNKDGKQLGKLDLSGDEVKFEGQADECAQIFFEHVIKQHLDYKATFLRAELTKKEAEFAEELRNIARKLPDGEDKESVALAIALREILVLVTKYTKEVSRG